MDKMTHDQWVRMTPSQKDAHRDNSGLSPQLIGLEGWRVEVLTTYGEKRRFIVGKSTGWRPCHLELSRRGSTSGGGAEKEYVKITKLYKVR